MSASSTNSPVPPEPATRSYAPGWLSWSVWMVAASFYLAGFYLRVSPAVITAELMRDFSITAGQLGGLSAAFFYAYVLMQVPTGVLVDSWGARKLLITGALGAALGAVLFGVADNLAVATVGRALMGGATAVAWIITLKLASHWFPQRRFAMLTGLGLLVGNIGALFAQVPLRLLVDAFGWRGVTFGSAAVVAVVAVLAGGSSGTTRTRRATAATRPTRSRTPTRRRSGSCCGAFPACSATGTRG